MEYPPLSILCSSQTRLKLCGIRKFDTSLVTRRSPEVAANANPYATHPIMTHSRLEPLVAWILAAYSKQEVQYLVQREYRIYHSF